MSIGTKFAKIKTKISAGMINSFYFITVVLYGCTEYGLLWSMALLRIFKNFFLELCFFTDKLNTHYSVFLFTSLEL